MRCDDCQALLLDHLYGLLDGPEAVALDAHLAGCAGCTAAREQAARVRGLFARAAKSSFPDVRFVPPAQPAESAAPVSGPPLAEPAPAPTAPFGRRPARREPVGWAAVAVVLVLTPAVVLPVRSITGRYDAARRGADEATSRFAEARAERDRIADAVRTVVRPVGERYAAAAKRHHEVLSNWVARELVADKADRDRKLTVKVERPAAVQPGAPNELVVSVDGRGAVLPPGHVEAEVLDEAGHVLARQPIEPGPRPQTVRIPAEVWAHLKPQSELFLAV